MLYNKRYSSYFLLNSVFHHIPGILSSSPFPATEPALCREGSFPGRKIDKIVSSRHLGRVCCLQSSGKIPVRKFIPGSRGVVSYRKCYATYGMAARSITPSLPVGIRRLARQTEIYIYIYVIGCESYHR